MDEVQWISPAEFKRLCRSYKPRLFRLYAAGSIERRTLALFLKQAEAEIKRGQWNAESYGRAAVMIEYLLDSGPDMAARTKKVQAARARLKEKADKGKTRAEKVQEYLRGDRPDLYKHLD